MQKWHVNLEKSESKKIKMVLRSKKLSMETKKRAQILKDLDESDGRKPESVGEIARKRGVCQNTVIYTRKTYAEEGIDAAVFRKKRETPPVAAKVTGEVEAHIIACACSVAPPGFTRWSMKMIANKIVLDGVVESISDETVRLVLKKHNLSRT
jgi:transposase-like protein